MNLGRNAVAPSEFPSPNLPQNVDLFCVNNADGPSYYSPQVTEAVPAAATTSTSGFSTVTIAILAVLGLIIGGVVAAVVIIVVRASSQQGCSGFTCTSDGTCLTSSARCNSVLDCNDGSDESGCSDTQFFTCIGSSNVINRDSVCDGVEHCPGGTDEDRCITAPDADNGGVVQVYSVSSGTYYKICGYEDGWTDAKSDTVCGILGFQSSGSTSEEEIDVNPGVSSSGSFSLTNMVQQTPAACTNNRVMRISCVRASTCGQPLTRFSKIVGGSNADITDYPWQVSLQRNGNSFCGGTIVGYRWVVTAAHCVTGFSSFSNIHVVAGITRLDESLDSFTEYDIETVTMHPLYSATTFFMDIALIKISSEFSLSSTIQMICLPPPGRKYQNLATVVASGWGTTYYEASSLPTILQAVNINLYNTEECISSTPYTESHILAGMICAGVSGGGKDTCQGDSGGPLTITLSGVAYLVGATSWGHECAVAGFLGVYAEISYARSWIDRNMS